MMKENSRAHVLQILKRCGSTVQQEQLIALPETVEFKYQFDLSFDSAINLTSIPSMQEKQNKLVYVVIFLLVITNAFSFYRLHFHLPAATNVNDNSLKFKDIIDSEEYASYLEGQTIQTSLLEEIAKAEPDNEALLETFGSPIVICTLFSTVGCTVCLDTEMRRIETFYQWAESNKLPVAICGIAHSSSRETLLRFKRATGFSFPLFVDQSDTMSKHFHLKAFPITLLIDSRSKLILKATHPVKMSLEWSEHFYTFAKSLLKSEFVKKR